MMTEINRRGADRCTVCGQPVLRIEGEYRNIDTYNMSERLVDAGAFGDIHVACLSQSVWEPDWHELTLHRFMVIFERDGEALKNGGMLFSKKGTYHYYSPDQSLVKITDDDIKAVKKSGDTYLLERNAELELAFTDEGFKTNLLNGLKTKGVFPFWPLAQHLNITDKFCNPENIQEARLLFDRGLARHWDFGAYWCKVQHKIAIAAEAIEMIKTFKR